MPLSPSWRKFFLTVHVTSSVGWIGAVLAYLALVGAVLTDRDAHTLQGDTLAMRQIAYYIRPAQLALRSRLDPPTLRKVR